VRRSLANFLMTEKKFPDSYATVLHSATQASFGGASRLSIHGSRTLFYGSCSSSLRSQARAYAQCR
jgi:hypothetical protein